MAEPLAIVPSLDEIAGDPSKARGLPASVVVDLLVRLDHVRAELHGEALRLQVMGNDVTARPTPPTPNITLSDDVRAYTREGIARYQQGRLNEAAWYFEQAVRLAPEDGHGFNNLANIYLFQERYDEAIANYRHALGVLPDNPEFYNHLSYAYSKSGNSPINGILKPGDVPPSAGLYLLDVVPDGEVRWGFPNISDIQASTRLFL